MTPKSNASVAPTLDDHDAFVAMDDAAFQRALATLLDVGTSIAKELKVATKDTGLPQWLAVAGPKAAENDNPPTIRLEEH